MVSLRCASPQLSACYQSVFIPLPLQSTLLLSSRSRQKSWSKFEAEFKFLLKINHCQPNLHRTVWHHYSRVSRKYKTAFKVFCALFFCCFAGPQRPRQPRASRRQRIMMSMNHCFPSASVRPGKSFHRGRLLCANTTGKCKTSTVRRSLLPRFPVSNLSLDISRNVAPSFRYEIF